MTNDAALREKFEAKMQGLGKMSTIRHPNGSLVYAVPVVQSAWLAFQFAWQASAEAERGRSWTLADLRDANTRRQVEWCKGGDALHADMSFRAMELGGETGEALNVAKKLERERHGWPGSRATIEELAQELADVIICADFLAFSAGIDLMAAVRAKFNATMDKVGLTVKLAALNRTASPDPNLVRAQHPDGVPCSCEQCTARRLAAQQET